MNLLHPPGFAPDKGASARAALALAAWSFLVSPSLAQQATPTPAPFAPAPVGGHRDAHPSAITPLHAGLILLGGSIVAATLISWKGGTGTLMICKETTNADGSSSSTKGGLDLDGTGQQEPEEGATTPDDAGGAPPPGSSFQGIFSGGFDPANEGFHATVDIANYTSDVTAPGFGPSPYGGYTIDHAAEFTLLRPAGSAGSLATLQLPISIPSMTVAGGAAPETFGSAAWQLIVESPQLGPLFDASVAIDSKGKLEVQGDLPASAVFAVGDEAFVQGFSTLVTAPVPPGLSEVTLEVHFVAAAQQVEEQGFANLEWKGGVLGEQLETDVAVDPGSVYLQFLSTQTGPTPLAIFNPLDPRSLAVGLDLLPFLQVGVGAGPGQPIETDFPLSGSPALAGLRIHSQVATLSPSGSDIAALSEPIQATLAGPGDVLPVDNLMLEARSWHTGTPLADGRVLLVGGQRRTQAAPAGEAIGTFEFFDPNTESMVPGGSLPGERTRHSAVPLDDGRVLILGGHRFDPNLPASAWIYDPNSPPGLEITPTAPMSTGRFLHTATKLSDGRVFVAGGVTSLDLDDTQSTFASATATTELYDPVTDTWSPGPNLPLGARLGHGASRLADGRVLLTGGVRPTLLFGSTLFLNESSSIVFDPANGSIQFGDFLPAPRAFHGQLATLEGGALLTGGYSVTPDAGQDFSLTAASGHLSYGANAEVDVVVVGSDLGCTMCGFCHGPSEGYSVTWYCLFKCFPTTTTGSDLVDGLGTDAGIEGSGTAVYRLESDLQTLQQIAAVPANRAFAPLVPIQGETRALIAGGATGPGSAAAELASSDVLVLGSGIGL